MADHSSDEEEQTISTDSVVTKYKMASEMVNKILKEVVAKCVDGGSVLEICEFGDKRIEEETAKVFKKEKELHKGESLRVFFYMRVQGLCPSVRLSSLSLMVEWSRLLRHIGASSSQHWPSRFSKIHGFFSTFPSSSAGIAFPTCLSVNNCICHFSPLKSENDVTLKDGDVVKVDMGAHVDGYIAVVAHTYVIGATKEKPVTGRVSLLFTSGTGTWSLEGFNLNGTRSILPKRCPSHASEEHCGRMDNSMINI